MLANLIYSRARKPICEKYLTLPFQRTLLPRLYDGKDFIRDSADCRVENLKSVYVMNIGFDIRCCHSFGIHGQNLLFDILADARLILFQQLWLKLAFPIPRHGYLYFPEAGFDLLGAMSIARVIRILVSIVVLAISELFVQFGIRPFSMNSAMVSLKRF